MVAISFDPRINRQMSKNSHGVIIEEIEGLIRVYKDGHIERPPIIPSVPCNVATVNDVTAKDVVIDKFTNLWARIYVSQTAQARCLCLFNSMEVDFVLVQLLGVVTMSSWPILLLKQVALFYP